MKKLEITILGDAKMKNLQIVKTYIKEQNFKDAKAKNELYTFSKVFKDKVKLKLIVHELFGNVEKKSLPGKDCVIIIFDMTNRDSFEDVLNKYINFLRSVNYTNNIILFGTNNPEDKDALPKTDEDEISNLINVTEITGEFHDIGNKSDKERSDLIDNLIETAYEQAKESKKQKDCLIF